MKKLNRFFIYLLVFFILIIVSINFLSIETYNKPSDNISENKHHNESISDTCSTQGQMGDEDTPGFNQREEELREETLRRKAPKRKKLRRLNVTIQERKVTQGLKKKLNLERIEEESGEEEIIEEPSDEEEIKEEEIIEEELQVEESKEKLFIKTENFIGLNRSFSSCGVVSKKKIKEVLRKIVNATENLCIEKSIKIDPQQYKRLINDVNYLSKNQSIVINPQQCKKLINYVTYTSNRKNSQVILEKAGIQPGTIKLKILSENMNFSKTEMNNIKLAIYVSPLVLYWRITTFSGNTKRKGVKKSIRRRRIQR